MRVRILGAHNTETLSTGLISFLVDDTLAIDAGSLTRSLPLLAQLDIKTILVTHHHYDHIRDIPLLGLSLLSLGGSVRVVCSPSTQEALLSHLLDGALYPRLAEVPSPDAPTVRLTPVDHFSPTQVDGYTITAVPVLHGVPTQGYCVADSQGKSLFYAGDTAAGCRSAWEHVSPDLLLIEVTLPNSQQAAAVAHQHLTPLLLREELVAFRELKGWLPRVVVVHMNPLEEEGIRLEVADVAEELGADISLGYEGMVIDL